jgi:hypothetical protein
MIWIRSGRALGFFSCQERGPIRYTPNNGASSNPARKTYVKIPFRKMPYLLDNPKKIISSFKKYN